MDRILLTGATGAVGRRVLPLLVSAGHRVTAVGRTSEQHELLRAVGASPVSMNLLDPTSVRTARRGSRRGRQPRHPHAVLDAPDAVPPVLAGERPHPPRGSAVLASAATAAGVRRFIQESFAPIHADGGAAGWTERWPLRPASYNRTTLDAEASAERFGRGGAMGVVLRFAWFYGPDPMLKNILAG